jgi:hypothetical protein
MPVAVNPGAPKQKRDLLDYLSVGGAIANNLMMLPKAYNDARASGYQADKAQIETQSAQSIASGNLDNTAKAGGKYTPVAPQASADGSLLLPPGALESVSPDGKKSYWLPKDVADARSSKETAMRKEVEGNPYVVQSRQSTANMLNLMDAYKKGTNEDDKKLLVNYAKIVNPNLKGVDVNSIMSDPSLGEEVRNKIAWLTGDKSHTLGADERWNYFRGGAESFKQYGTQAAAHIENYKRLGNRDGFTPEDLGILDTTSKLSQDLDAMLSGKKKKLAPTAGSAPAQTPKPAGLKPGTVENGYRFKGGNPADQSSWEKM